MNCKKIISIILIILLVTTPITITPFSIEASETEHLLEYNATINVQGTNPNIYFSVDKVIDGKFKGTISVTNVPQEFGCSNYSIEIY